jgi:serine/threonine-protein kinase HipA
MTSEVIAELNVWLSDQCAGTLRQRLGALEFQYKEQWLEQPQAMPLSQSLPLQAEPFADQTCRKGNSGSGSPSSARSPDPMTLACWRRSVVIVPAR